MARINLLPWRAERRKQREREFYMALGASALGAVVVVMAASYWMSSRIQNQNERNNYLTAQISILDSKIERIKDLEKTRSQLLARKQIIEDLQSNRSQMVHMFNELAQTIPDGSKLTSLKQAGQVLTLEGVSESNTRVATYMRNLERSPNLGRSDLSKIENMAGKPNADRRMPYEFSLAINLRKQADTEAELPVPGTPEAGAAGSATAPRSTAVGAAAGAALDAAAAPAPAAPQAPNTSGEKKP